MTYEEFVAMWPSAIDNAVELMNTKEFSLVIYQTKLETDYRICRILLRKGEFRFITPHLFENLSITVEDKNRFSMLVSNDDYFPVFDHLIYMLSQELDGAVSSLEVENTLINSFQKYIALFAKKRKNEIFKIAGLYGELLVLKSLIDIKGSQVVKDWNGPNKNRHDFTLGEKAIEVKVTYKDHSDIAISNELQLFFEPPQLLFLRIFQLDIKESSSEDSVKLIINEIIELCENSDHKLVFINKLNDVGISFQEDLSLEPSLKIDILSSCNYRVAEAFPRITKEMIPDGIKSLKYSVELSNIPAELLTEDEDLWKQII